MKYSQKLRDPRWQARRLEIFQRDRFRCRLCNDDKTTLCVHHLRYMGNPWDVPNDDLVTLCEHCHAVVEKYKEFHSNNPLVNSKTLKFKNGFVCVILIEETNISFFSLNPSASLDFCVNHKDFSKIMHSVIDYWLQNDFEDLLIDPKYETTLV